jgi:Holliday junction resolvasome RuvABC endonuclease subunit
VIVLALDLGIRCGFCLGHSGEPTESGTWLLKRPKEAPAVAFGNLLEALASQFVRCKPDLVVKEAPLNLVAMKSPLDVAMAYGMSAIVYAICRRFGVRCEDVADSTVRKHFTGKGRWGDRALTKRRVLERCWQLAYFPRDVYDEDRADACAVYDWAVATLARSPPRVLTLFPPQAEPKRKRRA